MIKIWNAKIRRTSLNVGDKDILLALVDFVSGSSGQGLGYVLYNPHLEEESTPCDYTGWFIYRLLDVLNLEDWESLVGTFVRVESDHNKIYRIGHITEEKWFDLKKDWENFLASKGVGCKDNAPDKNK